MQHIYFWDVLHSVEAEFVALYVYQCVYCIFLFVRLNKSGSTLDGAIIAIATEDQVFDALMYFRVH